MGTKSSEDEPQAFNKAQNHPDPESGGKMTSGHLNGVQQNEETEGTEEHAYSLMFLSCRCMKN